MILIGLLYKSFIENLSTFPSHFIHVRKRDVSNVESIHFEYDFNGVELANSSTIDLSRLVKLGRLIIFIIIFIIILIISYIEHSILNLLFRANCNK